MKKAMVFGLLALTFSASVHAKMVRIDSSPTKGNRAYLVNQAPVSKEMKNGSYYQEMMEATKKENSSTSKASVGGKPALQKPSTSISTGKTVPVFDGPSDGSDLGPPTDDQQDKAPPPIKKAPPMKDDAGKKLKKKLEEDKKSLDVKEDDKFYPLPSSQKSSRFGMAQTKGPSPNPMAMPHQEHFTKTLYILIGLLVLVFFTVWLFRRLSFGKFPTSRGSSGGIHILSRRPISPKTMLYVVEVEGKKTLIAESQLEVKALTQLSEKKNDPDL